MRSFFTCVTAFRLYFAAVLVAANVAFSSDESSKVSNLRHGYVHCGSERKPSPVPVYEHPCNPKPVAELKCGEAVDIFSREGPWLKIRRGDGTERYISFYSVSYSKKYYLPIDLSAAEGTYIPDCRVLPTHAQLSSINVFPNTRRKDVSPRCQGRWSCL